MKVVVFGATGVVGRAATEHFAGVADGGVIAVSRRPVTVEGVTHVAVDLADESTTASDPRTSVLGDDARRLRGTQGVARARFGMAGYPAHGRQLAHVPSRAR